MIDKFFPPIQVVVADSDKIVSLKTSNASLLRDKKLTKVKTILLETF